MFAALSRVMKTEKVVAAENQMKEALKSAVDEAQNRLDKTHARLERAERAADSLVELRSAQLAAEANWETMQQQADKAEDAWTDAGTKANDIRRTRDTASKALVQMEKHLKAFTGETKSPVRKGLRPPLKAFAGKGDAQSKALDPQSSWLTAGPEVSTMPATYDEESGGDALSQITVMLPSAAPSPPPSPPAPASAPPAAAEELNTATVISGRYSEGTLFREIFSTPGGGRDRSRSRSASAAEAFRGVWKRLAVFEVGGKLVDAVALREAQQQRSAVEIFRDATLGLRWDELDFKPQNDEDVQWRPLATWRRDEKGAGQWHPPDFDALRKALESGRSQFSRDDFLAFGEGVAKQLDWNCYIEAESGLSWFVPASAPAQTDALAIDKDDLTDPWGQPSSLYVSIRRGAIVVRKSERERKYCVKARESCAGREGPWQVRLATWPDEQTLRLVPMHADAPLGAKQWTCYSKLDGVIEQIADGKVKGVSLRMHRVFKRLEGLTGDLLGRSSARGYLHDKSLLWGLPFGLRWRPIERRPAGRRELKDQRLYKPSPLYQTAVEARRVELSALPLCSSVRRDAVSAERKRQQVESLLINEACAQDLSALLKEPLGLKWVVLKEMPLNGRQLKNETLRKYLTNADQKAAASTRVSRVSVGSASIRASMSGPRSSMSDLTARMSMDGESTRADVVGRVSIAETARDTVVLTTKKLDNCRADRSGAAWVRVGDDKTVNALARDGTVQAKLPDGTQLKNAKLSAALAKRREEKKKTIFGESEWATEIKDHFEWPADATKDLRPDHFIEVIETHPHRDPQTSKSYFRPAMETIDCDCFIEAGRYWYAPVALSADDLTSVGISDDGLDWAGCIEAGGKWFEPIGLMKFEFDNPKRAYSAAFSRLLFQTALPILIIAPAMIYGSLTAFYTYQNGYAQTFGCFVPTRLPELFSNREECYAGSRKLFDFLYTETFGCFSPTRWPELFSNPECFRWPELWNLFVLPNLWPPWEALPNILQAFDKIPQMLTDAIRYFGSFTIQLDIDPICMCNRSEPMTCGGACVH